MIDSHLKFDKPFFRDFWQLLTPYWRSEEKGRAFKLLIANIFCIIIGVQASVAVNTFYKDFYNALQNFDKAAVITALFHFGIIFTISLLSYGYAFYFNGLLTIRWRQWLTKNYLNKWLHNHNHYRLQLLNSHVDNPDQRISEDLAQFPATTISLFFTLFQSLLTLISFSYILWQLSGSITIPIGAFYLVIPGYLLWGALFYALMGTRIVAWIGKKLASIEYQQQRLNADFRFSLVRFREASEQIALYRGEANENNKFLATFQQIFNNYLSIIGLRKHLTFFTNGYDMVASLCGILISIPLYFQKKILLGGIMQIASAFNHVISALSVLINAFSLVAEWRAVVSRLTEFNHSMEFSSSASSSIVREEHDQSDVIIKNLTLSLPDGKTLLNNINLVFPAGGSFLLDGRSGLGKSTLLRALAGLWDYGEGQIKLPKKAKIFFLPQKSYLPLGSLKDILLYPFESYVDKTIITEALERCALIKLHHQLTETKNWAQEFSPGEQQLIAFARIFLCKPDIIFLDEATSALDEKTELQIYRNLREFLPNATIVSVGHRSSLQQFHQKIITLSSQENFSSVSASEIVTI